MGKILLCGVPDFIQVDTEILVNKKMPHCNDILPWNSLMLFLELRRGPICSFPYDLNMVEDPDLEKIRLDKFLFCGRDFLQNTVDCFINIQEPVPIGSHKGTASCSTEWRICSFSP